MRIEERKKSMSLYGRFTQTVDTAWVRICRLFIFTLLVSMLIMADRWRMQTVTTLNVSKVIKRKIMPMSNDNCCYTRKYWDVEAPHLIE
jgi:hypothetical protein